MVPARVTCWGGPVRVGMAEKMCIRDSVWCERELVQDSWSGPRNVREPGVYLKEEQYSRFSASVNYGCVSC